MIPDPITYTWFLETPRFNAANGISIGSADSAVTTPHARDRRTHTHRHTHRPRYNGNIRRFRPHLILRIAMRLEMFGNRKLGNKSNASCHNEQMGRRRLA